MKRVRINNATSLIIIGLSNGDINIIRASLNEEESKV